MIGDFYDESSNGKAIEDAPSQMVPFQLLLNVLTRYKLLHYRLLYIVVKANNNEVLALLDTCAIHNFGSGNKVADLDLKITKSSCQVKALNFTS